MDIRLKKYLPTKMIAIGFIIMVLLGNYWLVKMFTVKDYKPGTLADIFLVVAIWTVFWMIPFIIKSISYKLDKKVEDKSEDE